MAADLYHRIGRGQPAAQVAARSVTGSAGKFGPQPIGRTTRRHYIADDTDATGAPAEREHPMALTVKELMDAANAAVPRVTAAQASEMMAKGALVVDVRDASEVEKSGKVAGAVHVPRSLLEFKCCPTSATHDNTFDKSRPVILYCGSGGRAALGGKLLKDLGYNEVYNMGGFKDWTDAGGKIG